MSAALHPLAVPARGTWDHRFAERTRHMRRSAVRELLKLTTRPDFISLAGGLPAPELFPIGEVRRASEAVLTRHPKQALQYGETEGLAGLRDWIANHLSSPGLTVKRTNVLVTTGAQQALDLIGRVFLDPGDRVLVENPTYLAALSAWRPLGVGFLAMPSDADGMCVDAMPPLLKQRPKLAYCIPNFQNPQGTTLSGQRRNCLVDLLHGEDVVFVEDNPYGDLRYSGKEVPHVLTLSARLGGSSSIDGSVIYIGTFSKVLAPGFRVGWVVAPEPVIEKLVLAKQAADLHTSTLNQHIILELVADGFLDRHIPLLRSAYRERRDGLVSALERLMPPEISWTRPEGGMFAFVTLPSNMIATTLLTHALERKVAFVPGEEFHIDGAGTNTLRLSFTGVTPENLARGVERLAEAIEAAGRVDECHSGSLPTVRA